MADYKKYDKYDPANPHTRYMDTDPVTTKVYLDMMKDPKRRESYLNEIDTYDAKQRAAQKEAKKAAPMPALKPKAKPVAVDEDYMPADIKDKLQDKKNKDAAENYEATKEYKKGGSVSARADGCAQRGKTRGRMV